MFPLKKAMGGGTSGKYELTMTKAQECICIKNLTFMCFTIYSDYLWNQVTVVRGRELNG